MVQPIREAENCAPMVCEDLRISRNELSKAVNTIMVEGDREYHVIESDLRTQINAIESRAAEECRERAANRERNS